MSGLFDRLKQGYHSFIEDLNNPMIPVKVRDPETGKLVWANKRVTSAYNNVIREMEAREHDVRVEERVRKIEEKRRIKESKSYYSGFRDGLRKAHNNEITLESLAEVVGASSVFGHKPKFDIVETDSGYEVKVTIYAKPNGRLIRK